ncbi:MAG: NusA N-terminal domain-containing protein, partial [Clostridia bacterium]|nr:NusA N-terminal domain-containing protein [Clostridia bacterium]
MKKKVKEDSLREILALLEMEKGLKPAVIEEAIKTSLVSAYKKNYGNDVNVRIEFNEKTDAIDVFIDRVVVAEVSDPQVEISLLEAQAQYPQAKIGDTISEKDEPKNFGRIAAQTAKQVIVQKLREAERGYVFKEFASRESDIVTGIVDRIDHGVCTVHLNNADGMLPATEQIPGEEILPGQRLKAYIVEVRNAPKGPQIILSRIHSDLLSRLFELEVPEIQDGYVEIKS